jgi:hypothetical protein
VVNPNGPSGAGGGGPAGAGAGRGSAAPAAPAAPVGFGAPVATARTADTVVVPLTGCGATVRRIEIGRPSWWSFFGVAAGCARAPGCARNDTSCGAGRAAAEDFSRADRFVSAGAGADASAVGGGMVGDVVAGAPAAGAFDGAPAVSSPG